MKCENAKRVSEMIGMRLNNFENAIGPERLQKPLDISARKTSESSATKTHVLYHYRPFNEIHCSKYFCSSYLLRSGGLVFQQIN